MAPRSFSSQLLYDTTSSDLLPSDTSLSFSKAVTKTAAAVTYAVPGSISPSTSISFSNFPLLTSSFYLTFSCSLVFNVFQPKAAVLTEMLLFFCNNMSQRYVFLQHKIKVGGNSFASRCQNMLKMTMALMYD